MATISFCLALSLLPASLGNFLAPTRKVAELSENVPAIRREDIELLWKMTGQALNTTTTMEEQTWLSYRPCATCQQFVRVGEGHDGGYLMCAELIKGTKALYSYGINGFDGWGAMLSNHLGGAVVEQYDCFNLNRPTCPSGLVCNFNFHPECLATTNKTVGSRPFASLTDHMTQDGHLPGPDSSADMVMKMDIEGAEWAVLADERNKPLLEHFSQLVVEFHGTHKVTPIKGKAMQNLLDIFAIVHVHSNNCCDTLNTTDGYRVPQVLEVSFARRGLVKEGECLNEPQETILDHRNVQARPAPTQMKLGLGD